MRDINKNWFLILVPSFVAFLILVYVFYIHTNIGYSDTVLGYVTIYAPAWFEALVTTLFIPFIIGFYIHDEVINY